MADQSEYILSWDEFHRDTRELATLLLNHSANQLPWHGIIAIARGGLVPAAILARELDIRLVDSLCIASYDHDQQGELNVIKSIEGEGEGFLLIDDLVDSGATARVVKEMLPRATFATIYAKPAARELADHYVRDIPQDTWLHFPWDVALNFSKPLLVR